MRGRRGFTILELVLVFALIATLSSMALPVLGHFQRRARASEVKMNLRALHAAQQSHYLETSRYAVSLGALFFAPDRGNRYAYFLSAAGTIQLRDAAILTPCSDCSGLGADTFRYGKGAAVDGPTGWVTPTALLSAPGVGGECPRCEYLVEAAAQTDQDAGLDIWSVSSASRVHRMWGGVPGGEPLHERDDSALP